MEQLPPHDIEAEEAVLGALLLWQQAEPEKVTEVMMSLQPKHFYREKNAWVYGACLSLWKEGKPIDQVMVANKLAERFGWGKVMELHLISYLSYLIQQTPTPVHVLSHSQIVFDAYQKRITTG